MTAAVTAAMDGVKGRVNGVRDGQRWRNGRSIDGLHAWASWQA